VRDCLLLQAVKTPYCHWSSRFPLLLNYVQEFFYAQFLIKAHLYSNWESITNPL